MEGLPGPLLTVSSVVREVRLHPLRREHYCMRWVVLVGSLGVSGPGGP